MSKQVWMFTWHFMAAFFAVIILAASGLFFFGSLLIDEQAYIREGAPFYEVFVAPLVAGWPLWLAIAVVYGTIATYREIKKEERDYQRIVRELYAQLENPHVLDEDKGRIRLRLALIERNRPKQPLRWQKS